MATEEMLARVSKGGFPEAFVAEFRVFTQVQFLPRLAWGRAAWQGAR